MSAPFGLFGMSMSAQEQATKVGVISAIAAYCMWGVAPLYFKQLQDMPATDVLVHRVVWSVVVLVGLLFVAKQWPKVKVAMTSPKVMGILLAAGLLLAGNWLLFIWSVNNGHLLDASLGYYINPLINVLFGFLFLQERLRRLQQIAVIVAAVGVTFAIVAYGRLPWIALVLAVTFSIYGLLRKQVSVDSMPGLFIETLMMFPIACYYWWQFGGEGSDMTSNSLNTNLWLMAAGIVTTAPLLCFTAAARRIRYSTLGFFQYIGPSIMFVLATTLFGEPLSTDRLVTFAFVWAALLLFTWDSYRVYRKERVAMS